MKNIFIFDGFSETIFSVITAVAPLIILFLIFQFFLLKLPRKYVIAVFKGTLIAALGLLLFLQGVHIAFIPYGKLIGEALGALPFRWPLIILGLILGFLTTWGEPSVRILAQQVDHASSGSIKSINVIFTVCIGVSAIVGLGMLRIIYNIPLLAILLPGYMLVLVLLWFSDSEFLAIAVDAGGVATGPMANTFILALALGVSSAMGGKNLLISGLGMVSLIAMAPIISVMVLGLIFRIKKHFKE